MIFCKKHHAAAIDKAVFPGLQGGTHNHTTAAIAVAAREALEPSFKTYAKAGRRQREGLAAGLMEKGFGVTTGARQSPLLVDLTSKNIPGSRGAGARSRGHRRELQRPVPFDPRKPFDPSGLRIGTPSVTSRGMGKGEMEKLAIWIEDRVITKSTDEAEIAKVAAEVKSSARSPCAGHQHLAQRASAFTRDTGGAIPQAG